MLTIETPERRHCRRSGIFIVSSKQILHLVLVFLLLTLSRCCYVARSVDTDLLTYFVYIQRSNLQTAELNLIKILSKIRQRVDVMKFLFLLSG